MTEQKNTIGGIISASAAAAGSAAGDVGVPKLKPGAIVEDESLSGREDGSVVPKTPGGESTVEGATDARENPST